MKLFYTTVGQQDLIQQKKEFSLGGYKSASQVQNQIGNLFSEISILSEEKKLDEYIGLILWNDTGASVDNISLWFEYPVNESNEETNFCKFLVSAVALDANNMMEHVENKLCKPFNAVFYEANGRDNAVGLGFLEDGTGIGIWIKRSFIEERLVYKKDNDTINQNFLNSVEPITLENITMKIDWVDGYYGGDLGGGNL